MAAPDAYLSKRHRSRSPRRKSRSPPRRRSFSRSRSRSRDDFRRDRRSRSPVGGGNSGSNYNSFSSRHYGRGGGSSSNYDDRSVAKKAMLQSIRENSQQERRVYVGNLSYDVKWHHLKDFMRQAGDVLFADVLLLSNGMSKGCGIVEYATKDQALNAVRILSNQNFMGRMVYIREDRESEPRFIPSTGSSRSGVDSFRGDHASGYCSNNGRQIYIGNLPYSVGWQDLKDLFRQAGNVIRADINVSSDGRSKGSGVVLFETSDDARNAIFRFNGYEWQGRTLEVREDRYHGGSYSSFNGRDHQNDEYDNYSSGRSHSRSAPGPSYSGRGTYNGFYDSYPNPPPNPFTDHATSGGERSSIIYVRNLPWSTSNEDLVELFTTIGKVERAEIQYEPNGRSRGTGIVEFDNEENADMAISKFTGYQYGGRPLGISYVRYTNYKDDNVRDSDSNAHLAQDPAL